jgi:triosephosphate isomerase (TIM)
VSRSPFVVANWKMNHARAIARAWCSTLAELHAAHPWPAEVECGVAPPFTSLDAVKESLGKLPVLLGAQNVHQETNGAFTGEVSAEMLADAGCRFVIVGHSERRHIFGESDERIAAKVAAAHRAGLLPVLCVGETEHQRDEGRTESVIEHQLRKGLERFSPASGLELVLAYEPVWAIGTGKVAQPAQAQEAQEFLRNTLSGLAGAAIGRDVRILYGGSVTPANAAGLAALPDIDGFLVGGASLDASGYHRIVLAAAERA